MTARAQRRVAVCLVGALGVADLVLAAGRRTHVRATFVAARWAAQAVIGARFLLLAAGLVLVLVTRGLVHGKRNAWRLALAVSVASFAGHHVKESDALGLSLTACAIAALVATRRAFRARSDPALARRGVQLLVAGELLAFVYGTAGLYLMDRQFRTEPTLAQSAREAVRLLVLLPTSVVEPATRHGSWFVDSVRVAALGVALVAVARVLAPFVRPHGRSEREQVERLLDAWATSPLAYFTLLDDKSWFLSEDGEAFIGYVLVGTTAVALGGPVGSPSARRAVVHEFAEMCDLNGWTPCLHQVDDELGDALADAGFKLLKIGEEAIVDVRTWTEEAKEYKQLRSALRRVERAGLEVTELAQPLDDATVAELHRVSDAWMADGGHRERTFTLGSFDPAYLRATRVFVVRERGTGHIVAFANVLPRYRSTIGNFDLMRRLPDAPNGVMEQLFVALIHRFRDEGCTGMTLGLAPMANIEGDSLPERALRLLYVQGNRAFNYQGLHRFKDKWHPAWEPRFLAYRSETELPKVAAAVVRAGELPDPARWRNRARALARRIPFSLAFATLTVWLMAATSIDRDGHPTLMRLVGLRWHDLVHLQVWRLPTAQLLQTRPGFVWGNVALCFLALPVAEWLLGTRATIACFWAADWASTVLVLVAARLLAATGNAGAVHVIATRDAGPSAGAWALVAATAFGATNRHLRRWGLAVAFAFLLGALALGRGLADVQHLLAAVLALGASLVARRHRSAPRRQRPRGRAAPDRIADGTAHTGAGAVPART